MLSEDDVDIFHVGTCDIHWICPCLYTQDFYIVYFSIINVICICAKNQVWKKNNIEYMCFIQNASVRANYTPHKEDQYAK